MKKMYFMLIAIFGLSLLAGCPEPQTPTEKLIHATIGTNISESISPIINQTNGRVDASVPGFNQKFGLVTVLLINDDTGKGYTFTSNGSVVVDVLVPAGTYDIFMETEAPSPFYPYTNYIPFDAESLNVIVTDGSTTILTATVDRALVLFHKSGLDNPPTIVDYSTTTPQQFPSISFWSDTQFYYVYVYGTWSYTISYTLGGVSSNFNRTFLPGKIYVYDINSNTITVPDLFTEVITNN